MHLVDDCQRFGGLGDKKVAIRNTVNSSRATDVTDQGHFCDNGSGLKYNLNDLDDTDTVPIDPRPSTIGDKSTEAQTPKRNPVMHRPS